MSSLHDPAVKRPTPLGVPAYRASRALLGEDRNPGSLNFLSRALAQRPPEEVTDMVVKSLRPSVQRLGESVYVSTPITGGVRLYQFMAEVGVTDKKQLTPEQHEGVMKQNIQASERVCEKVRKKGATALNPTAMSVNTWTQSHYNRHWLALLNNLSFDSLRVCAGWQLSYGCLLEVRTALDKGLEVKDELGVKLNRTRAQARVDEATTWAEKHGFQVGELARVLTAPLESLALEH